MTNRLAIPLLALAAAACAPKKLPGTDVQETRDTRAIYGVIRDTVDAMNRHDAAAVLANVAADYFDDAATPDPSDDLDRERLEKALVQDFARVESSKLSVQIRKIEVQGDQAFAELFYDSYYRVQTPTGLVPRRDADVHRLRFERVQGAWRIASGL